MITIHVKQTRGKDMDNYIKELHLKAGLKCGKEHTCQSNGKDKVDYKNEETATKVADKMSKKYSKEMEAYPCAFCEGWHIGRKMSVEELEEIASL